MHSLLQRQLHRFIGTSSKIPPKWRQFIEAVDLAYRNHDGDRFLIERSLELTSKELVEQNERLRGELEDRKAAEERIHTLAFHDCLTGLPNRTLLCDRLDIAIAQARRTEKKVAVLFIDLDRFKTINDSLGHHIGDILLKEVAERIKKSVRKEDTVCRLGGDEFVIILSNIQNTSDAALVAAKLENALAIPFYIQESELHITHSTGISIFPHDGQDIDTLLRNADAAMYCAKENGRNNYHFFTADLNARAFERLALETSLRRALEREEFILSYQPQVSLATGRIICMEALVRWQHPELGLISPGKFIPLAEETGLIVPLADWVLRTACARAKAWQDAGRADIGIAVNISPRQFRQKNLVQKILSIVGESGLDPKFLELELTEGLMMQNPEEAIQTITQLKNRGVQFSIDDFGTGYSSLSYLKRFPIDRLKIDRSFVHEISTGTIDAAIVTAMISLAHALKLRVVAEGVETAEELAFLREHGCDEIQGYYFCHPLREIEATNFLKEGASLYFADFRPLKRGGL